MTDFLIPDTLTTQQLRDIFESALFDTVLDEDGDLVVQDTYRIIVTTHSKRFVRFFTIFGLKEGVDPDLANALANRVNDRLILVRAAIKSDKLLILDYYLPMMGGGLSRKALVMAFRVFGGLVGEIGDYDTDHLIR